MTHLVGILNITPDSFSDGGQFHAPEAAFERYAQLVADGAAIVDIGAESTRPGATPLTPDEEWARLGPVLARLPRTHRLSIDTRHAATAARALDNGVAMINDVSGFADPAMAPLLAQADCRVIVMHALTVPADPSVHWPEGTDPIAAILAWKSQLLERVALAGIAPERLIFDPGLGFGKTHEQSMALVQRAPELLASGGDWLYGHSRKSFLSLITDAAAPDRDAATLLLSRQLVAAGVHYLRVHDVRGHAEALCT